MKIYKIKIDSSKEQISAPFIELVAKDYNSTTLEFECDNANDYMMIFQLLRPDGTVWRKEIRDNKVVLGDENENGEIVPVITVNGDYWFDVAFYDGDSKITTTKQDKIVARADIPQEDVSELPPKSVLDDLIEDVSKAINEVGNIRQDGDYAKEQGDYAKSEAEKVDNVVDYVTTTSEQAKDIAEAAESIAKGANQSLSFGNYATMVSVFNVLNNDTYRTGQNVLIVTLNVPDLWVSDVAEESVVYTYTTDEDLTTLLKEQGYIQVGYYKLSALETQKVDLTNYVKNTDYATYSKAGLVRPTNGIEATGNGGIGISRALNRDIDTRTNNYKPIVPSNLDYAVGSVKASESQSGTAKMWTSTNEDGEVGLNISTEV